MVEKSRSSKIFTLHEDIKNVFNSKEHANKFLTKLRTLLQKDIFCDVELISGVDGKRLKSHRLVLCSASEYFATKLINATREAHQKEVVLNRIGSSEMVALIKFCYTGTIELCAATVQSLLDAASLLQITEVINECNDFISSQLNPENCVRIFLYAGKKGHSTLLANAEAYICENFMHIHQTKDFLQLSYDDLTKLLAKSELCVPSEEKVFECIMKWIKYNDFARSQFFDQLLALVRLPLLQLIYLEHVQRFCVSAKSKQLVIEAMMYNIVPQSRTHTVPVRKRALRDCHKLWVIGSQENTNKIFVQVYSPLLNSWDDLELNEIETDCRPYAFEIVAVDNCIYMVGGKDNGAITNRMRQLNMFTMTLTDLSAMNTRRVFLRVCAYKHNIYAIGGSNEAGTSNSVECFDTLSNTWNDIAPLSVCRRRHAAAIMDERLYVAGGFNDEMGVLNSVEWLDLATHENQWNPCNSMNTKRYDFGFAAHNGFLYAVGGYIGHCAYTKAVERYDPQANNWTMLGSLNIARALFGCVFINDCLYVIGGNTGSCIRTVEKYYDDKDKWLQVAAMPIGDLARVTAVPIAHSK